MLNNFRKMSVVILLLNLFYIYGCTKNPDGSYTIDTKAFIISALSEKSTPSNMVAAASNPDNMQNKSNAIYNSQPYISQIERWINDGLIAKEDYEKYAKPGIPNVDIKSPQDHSLIYQGIYVVPWAKNATLRITYKGGNLYNVDMKDGDPHAAISIIITEQEKRDTGIVGMSYNNDCWQYKNILLCPLVYHGGSSGNPDSESCIALIQESPKILKFENHNVEYIKVK